MSESIIKINNGDKIQIGDKVYEILSIVTKVSITNARYTSFIPSDDIQSQAERNLASEIGLKMMRDGVIEISNETNDDMFYTISERAFVLKQVKE